MVVLRHLVQRVKQQCSAEHQICSLSRCLVLCIIYTQVGNLFKMKRKRITKALSYSLWMSSNRIASQGTIWYATLGSSRFMSHISDFFKLVGSSAALLAQTLVSHICYLALSKFTHWMCIIVKIIILILYILGHQQPLKGLLIPDRWWTSVLIIIIFLQLSESL